MNQKGQLTATDISNNLLSLTRKSVSDNATVVAVTIITLIYLPTQLVAVSGPVGQSLSSAFDLRVYVKY